jgi:nicotinate-nucleotide adenylyltransferase
VNIALFGGTFDPVHTGHLRAAKRAARRFRLDRVLFVPSGIPPHKRRDKLTAFHHRYAMVTLACAADPRFVPSLLEAPRGDRKPDYSINTARAVKRSLGPRDQLFFLLGADAFLDLPHWKEYRRLLETMNFIVVSRPGVSSKRIWKTVPREMVRAIRGTTLPEMLQMRRTALHLLRGVDVPVASRDIREAVGAGRRVTGLVPPLVEQYIAKEGLYRPAQAGHGQ